MIGRRIHTRAEWNEQRPGDYLWDENTGRWWVRDPDGNPGTLGAAHTVTEHEDGTITVEPSIWDYPNGWHGWLRRGEWTSV